MLVYDQFIWKYLWVPVVADAAGHPMAYERIRTVPDYYFVNTVTYLVTAIYSLPGLWVYLDALKVSFDARLAYGFAPIITPFYRPHLQRCRGASVQWLDSFARTRIESISKDH